MSLFQTPLKADKKLLHLLIFEKKRRFLKICLLGNGAWILKKGLSQLFEYKTENTQPATVIPVHHSFVERNISCRAPCQSSAEGGAEFTGYTLFFYWQSEEFCIFPQLHGTKVF